MNKTKVASPAGYTAPDGVGKLLNQYGCGPVAFTGKDGGRLPDLAEYCFVVPSFSIHRIQETHVTLYHVVWDLVHVALGEDDVI